MSRKTIPYSTFDDLEKGEEIRVKRLHYSHVSGTFLGFYLDCNCDWWLRMALPNEYYVLVRDVQWSKGLPMVQRLSHVPSKHDDAVLLSIWEGDSRVVNA